MGVEEAVSRHYARDGLEQAILDGLAASGKDIDRLAPADLAPVDEFHTGGRRATSDLAAAMGLRPGLRLLDIGCGIGGPARTLASEHDCHVTGIDLTADYVRVAAALSRRVGLGARTQFEQASALAPPFAPASFDGATLIHVGMNIADKAALFAAARRVLRPDGVLGLFEMMRGAPGEPRFPLPWASGAATSFVETAATYRRRLEDAGFAVTAERSRRDFALDFFRRMRERAGQGEPPPLALHILMGASAAQKVASLIDAIERGILAPVEMVGRAIGASAGA